jgi:hypothetical protein
MTLNPPEDLARVNPTFLENLDSVRLLFLVPTMSILSLQRFRLSSSFFSLLRLSSAIMLVRSS